MKTLAKPRNKQELLTVLNPLVKEWFFSKFKEFSLPQLYGVMPIYERKNILISAPTGSTKTLTCFLSILNYLVDLAQKNELEDKIYAVYISPLKALNYDIQINLSTPLKEIYEIAGAKGIKLQEIRVNVRTGDTSAKERTQQLKKAPHILVTTPESLAILLTTKKFIDNLKAVEFMIIDEIHALACNKRGVHLNLSVERLEHISVITPVRIGLSATISPLEEIAKYLVGYIKEDKGEDKGENKRKNKEDKKNNWKEKECLIADISFTKKTDLKVLCPVPDLINTDSKSMSEGLYTMLDKLIQKHKTTLIFANTRSATERVINHLKEMFPKNYTGMDEKIGAHHSSLSKETRFRIEKNLREGRLKCCVTSSSLELGIDIGFIDLVILLGSPKSIARALQRVGRAGHQLHSTSKGRFIVLDRDDLVECSVMLKEAVERKIDKIQIPKNCLDVLSQQIYGMAIQQKWNINELFNLIKSSYCFNSLKRVDFFSVISYLAAEYKGLESNHVYGKIWYDPQTKELGKRGKLARVIYMTNVGTIPDESFINVVIAAPFDRKNEVVGMIDEAFLEKIKKGDVFVLGGSKYQFLYTRGMNAYVNASVRKSPTIPSWFSEMLPLSFDLALSIQRFRKLLFSSFKNKKSEKEIKKFIKNYLYVEGNSIDALYNYFFAQFHYTKGKCPDENTLLLEKWKNESGKQYCIFHSLYGRKVNDALSRALAYLIASRGKRDIDVGVNDNGFFLASYFPMQIEKALGLLIEKPDSLRQILEEAVEKTETFKRRFRHCAARSLMILRNYKGRNKTVGRQQMNSHFLLLAVQKISKDFPILKETQREILYDLMDVENAIFILNKIQQEKIKVETIYTNTPSPFSLGLVTQAHTDFMKTENKSDFLKRMHKSVLEKIKRNIN